MSTTADKWHTILSAADHDAASTPTKIVPFFFGRRHGKAASSSASIFLSWTLVMAGCSGDHGPVSDRQPARFKPIISRTDVDADQPDNVIVPVGLTDQEESAGSVRSAVYHEDTQSETPISDATPSEKTFCQDWPAPTLTLVVTGRLNGYLEPCGCTGLANAKGGLSRRHTFLRQISARKWPLLALDIGNQVRRFNKQAEIKFQTTIASMRTMGYDVIGLGPDDLRLSIGELAAGVMVDGDGRCPFVCANVDVLGENLKYAVLERGGLKIGITAVVGRAELANISSQELEISDPIDAMHRIMPEFLDKKCHLYVLLCHASLEESRAMAKEFPEFGVIVTAGGAEEPTFEPESIAGTRGRLIQVGAKGMYVGAIGLYPGQQPPLRYERIAMDSRFADSPEMMDAFALYQKQLESLGLEGLEIRPVPHPTRTGTFVGHETCGECHTSAYEVFENTPHFHATDSIVHPTERSAIPRHFDPECLSCHVTGWDPQGYFPYESGYWDLKKSIALHANGCENCHGPGSEHVAAENEEVEVSKEERDRLRAQMRISLDEARKELCYRCHDLDNSPDFDFDTYWEEVKHYGKD